ASTSQVSPGSGVLQAAATPASIAERTVFFAGTPLFTTPTTLKTHLFEPAEIKLAVAGVDVGGVIPMVQRLLANRRTLEFTFYERDKDVIVSGSLAALGLPGEAIRLVVDKSSDGKFVDLDQVATRVAAELMRRRLLGDPSNRIGRLGLDQFIELLDILDGAASLKQQGVSPRGSDYEA